MSKREHLTGGMVASEPWLARWYAPLVAIALGLIVLMVVALAVVEMLVANAPEPANSSMWTAPLERADAAPREGDGAWARRVVPPAVRIAVADRWTTPHEAGHPQPIPGGLQ
jgi:hypothetical protein